MRTNYVDGEIHKVDRLPSRASTVGGLTLASFGHREAACLHQHNQATSSLSTTACLQTDKNPTTCYLMVLNNFTGEKISI